MTQTVFLENVGTVAHLAVWWKDACRAGGMHHARRELRRSDIVEDDKLCGDFADHDDAEYPSTCDVCGALRPAFDAPEGERAYKSLGTRPIYRPSDGTAERTETRVGDSFFVKCWRKPFGTCWADCDGQHLHVICPLDGWWDVDSRASNCTMPDDRDHRCWVRHGDPRACRVHVDKNGKTCAAGAGSIQTTNWHGFLSNGVISENR